MTQSLEDYLETIYLVVRDKNVARVKDISERMNVKKPSVIHALKELGDRGFIVHEKYGYIELSEAGKSEAEKIFETHTLLKNFLLKILGVSEETAENDACQMEHVVSQETLNKIKNIVKTQVKI